MTKRKTTWAVVPVEPTPEMLAAATGYTVGENGGCCPAPELREYEAREIWALMLEAVTELPRREPFKLDPPPIYDEHYAATQRDSE